MRNARGSKSEGLVSSKGIPNSGESSWGDLGLGNDKSHDVHELSLVTSLPLEGVDIVGVGEGLRWAKGAMSEATSMGVASETKGKYVRYS